MTTYIPDWLNHDFMRKILNGSENDDSVEVIDLTSKAGVDAGENYGSVIIRSIVEYSVRGRVQKKSLMVKVSPMVEGPQKRMFDQYNIFDIEIRMMTSTLVKMEKVLKEENFRLKAETMYTSNGDPSIIVVEDLVPLGFRSFNRLAGLDLDHALLVIKRLAAFHASSVAVYEKNPEEMLSYDGGMCNEKYPDDWKLYFINALKNLATHMSTWPELGSRAEAYSKAFTKFSEEFYSKMAEELRPKENEFNVLNHGDCWTANQLFNYDKDGKVVDHIFVDFQISFWSSPAIDLLYFMNTSLNDDVDLHHTDHLLDEYLTSLTTMMKKFNCTTCPPSMAELKKYIAEKAMYEMLSRAIIMPLTRLDKKHVKSADDMFDPEAFAQTPYFNDINIRNIILRKLPYWESMHLIEL